MTSPTRGGPDLGQEYNNVRLYLISCSCPSCGPASYTTSMQSQLPWLAEAVLDHKFYLLFALSNVGLVLEYLY